MVLKTKKAKHLSLQPEFPCTEQTSERETVPQRDCWVRNKSEALRNHTDRNLPFSLHRFHVSQGASTPLTGYHFLREDFWNLQIRPGPPSPPLNHLNSNQAYNFLSQHQTHFSFGAALGLGCYLQAFSSCDEQGLLSSCTAWASQCRGFSPCGPRALEYRLSSWAHGLSWPRSMWDLPRPGIELVSPALVDRFLTTRKVQVFSFDAAQLLFQVTVLVYLNQHTWAHLSVLPKLDHLNSFPSVPLWLINRDTALF